MNLIRTLFVVTAVAAVAAGAYLLSSIISEDEDSMFETE